ncbi:hypothetical protein QBE54_04280 [Thermatribacter velox]|uniref:Carboxypeptidase regulatory-like domain-containing protein n=1 Tax=Thermatribacter velox TaxID=3039681 RepID=A0ABZ2YGN8_9BACT
MKKLNFAKSLALLTGLLFLLLFLTGCLQQGAQFGAPGGVSIQGKVAVPDSDCVVSSCTNPQVSSGNEPVPEVKVSLMGENGNNLVTYTNQCGEYEVSGAQDSCYILYAKVKDNMWVKQGIIPEGNSYNAGEANAYTTAQVIIYEVAKQLYPDQVQCSDIPGFVPTPELIEAVENALKECRDAQQDATVAQLASAIVRNLFGAPGGGVPGGGIVIVTGGGGNGGGGDDGRDGNGTDGTGDSENNDGNTYNYYDYSTNITNNYYYGSQDEDNGGADENNGGNGSNGGSDNDDNDNDNDDDDNNGWCGPGNGNGNCPNPGNGNGNLNGSGPGSGNNGQNNGWGNGHGNAHGRDK